MAKVQKVKVVNESGMGYVLVVAWIGAVVYFVGQVDGFWNVILAVLKACVWPAYLLYHLLQVLGA
ncbi:hypothetical protein KC963_04550 [Candidatus Saccharibacteria bacterium]|nr:hypothetical protein [Candidatus Saccharibacteria bacterium]